MNFAQQQQAPRYQQTRYITHNSGFSHSIAIVHIHFSHIISFSPTSTHSDGEEKIHVGRPMLSVARIRLNIDAYRIFSIWLKIKSIIPSSSSVHDVCHSSCGRGNIKYTKSKCHTIWVLVLLFGCYVFVLSSPSTPGRRCLIFCIIFIGLYYLVACSKWNNFPSHLARLRHKNPHVPFSPYLALSHFLSPLDKYR